MHTHNELDYFLRVLTKLHLPARLLRADALPDLRSDLGLRRLLGLTADYLRTFHENIPRVQENTVCRFTDDFGCCYLFFRLPRLPDEQILLIGPWVTSEVTRSEVLELAERFSLPASQTEKLELCFGNIQQLCDEAPLLAMVEALGELLWGGSDAFTIVDIRQELTGDAALPPPSDDADSGDIVIRMQLMETRYAYENELMETVTRGQHMRAQRMLASFSGFNFEERMSDPLRNMKNYAIVCNTLLRKAAERGGVHPIHLDRLSSHYARRIEALPGAARAQALMSEMVSNYCRLVRKHASVSYSSPVQKAIACIEADLTGDLSLRAIAGTLSISPGYLSALFHRETGQTLTEYVNQQRMETGARLLRTTRLQVQTVAQHCGFSDVNYFTKLFRKYYGVTPKKYREENGMRQGHFD